MTDHSQWSPPNWARLLTYLVGVGIFAWAATRTPPSFWVLAFDSVVLIGLSEGVFKQLKELLLGLAGRPVKHDPPSNPSGPTGETGG